MTFRYVNKIRLGEMSLEVRKQNWRILLDPLDLGTFRYVNKIRLGEDF